MTDTPESLSRPIVPPLDSVLGHSFTVLDDGFVRVVDYMGSDASIVQAARVSYGSGTKQLHEDRGLIRYLMRHQHTTPFEMCEIKLHVRAPMDCWRQWIRHRTASVNEYSTRYSIAIDSAQGTPEDGWRSQLNSNRQGSGGILPSSVGSKLSAAESDFQRSARVLYEDRLTAGVAREQARKDLPLSTYTEAYWKIDLHNLMHFLALRLDAHAQYEIRQYASVIAESIVRVWCPLAWAAFEDYRVHALTLSRLENRIVRELAAGHRDRALEIARNEGLIGAPGESLKRNREREEIDTKLVLLGFEVPWNDT